jgi:DNA (cytosine-5)-methyltransferase 1
MNAAYYNEHDPYAAQWLRNLIAAGHIAPGEVDERSIEDVLPSDLAGYTQCHFFAGIGVWSLALRRAGWPDDRSVWTGSCPCQPFSAAGKRGAFADERHLWPAWHHLIRQREPAVVFGEQVAAADGYAWLDLVQTDMEAAGYAFGPVVLPAAGLGAPHGRHRIFFVADAMQSRWAKRRAGARRGQATGSGGTVRVADANMPEQDGGRAPSGEQPLCDQRSDCAGTVEHAESEQERVSRLARQRRATGGHWDDADWLPCQGGKWRPIEPGTFPLAHGVACRMDKLRAFGNAISPQVAEAFIGAYLESRR